MTFIFVILDKKIIGKNINIGEGQKINKYHVFFYEITMLQKQDSRKKLYNLKLKKNYRQVLKMHTIFLFLYFHII
jgi:hypothetical protein